MDDLDLVDRAFVVTVLSRARFSSQDSKWLGAAASERGTRRRTGSHVGVADSTRLSAMCHNSCGIGPDRERSAVLEHRDPAAPRARQRGHDPEQATSVGDVRAGCLRALAKQ